MAVDAAMARFGSIAGNAGAVRNRPAIGALSNFKLNFFRFRSRTTVEQATTAREAKPSALAPTTS